jgi:hypothetical protein
MRTSERLLRLLAHEAAPSREPAVSVGEWKAIERESTRHGLSPLLHSRIRSLGEAATTPAPIAARLRDAYVHNGLRNTAAFEEIGLILQALGNAGVDAIVLKGAFLAQQVYRDAALRPMLDVDLLVHRPALRRAAEVLGSLGYRFPGGSAAKPAPDQGSHLPPLSAPGALPVELHWTLVPPTAAAIDLRHAWKTAREVEVAGAAVLALSPEHLLHHLCLHVSCHHRFRVPLLQLHDVAAVLRHFEHLDWELLATIADSHRTRRFVQVVLALARKAFPCEVHSAEIDRFSGLSDDDWVLETAWECLTGRWPREFPRFDERLRLDPRAASRTAHLRRVLLPPTEQLRSAYGLPEDSPWVYWHYFARPLNFVREHGRETMATLLERSTFPSLSRNWARLDRWTGGNGA